MSGESNPNSPVHAITNKGKLAMKKPNKVSDIVTGSGLLQGSMRFHLVAPVYATREKVLMFNIYSKKGKTFGKGWKGSLC